MSIAYNLQFAAWSWVGHERRANEDSISVWENHDTAALADGMGGHVGGAEASGLAVKSVGASLCESDSSKWTSEQAADWSQGAILAAHNKVRTTATEDPSLKDMGTTLLVARRFAEDSLVFGHVGDSRIYRWADDKLHQLTRDHTLVQSMVDQGVVANVRAGLAEGLPGHVLVQAVGVDPEPVPDVILDDCAEGTAWLLCSDGLTGMMTDHDIVKTLGNASDSLEVVAARLSAAVRGGHADDNVSFVLIRSVPVYGVIK